MAESKLRVGIIGLGRTASKLEDDPLRKHPCTHAGAYAAHPRTTIVAGADIDEEARERFGERWGVSSLYDDYREMLAAERLDIVSVCAYAPSRADMVIDAAAAGVRGIWCEKAVATTMGEARRMVDACDYHGVHTVVNYTRRWNPAYRAAADHIRRGDIGAPLSIVATFNGDLLHTGTHAFDAMRMLVGEAVGVSGGILEKIDAEEYEAADEAKKADLEDVGGYATIWFRGPVLGTVNAMSRKYFVFTIDVHGSKGAIRLGNDIEPELLKRGKSEQCSKIRVLRPHPIVGEEVAEIPQVEALVRAINNDERPACTLYDGMKALEMALAIHASHAEGGDGVPLPLGDDELRVRSW